MKKDSPFVMANSTNFSKLKLSSKIKNSKNSNPHIENLTKYKLLSMLKFLSYGVRPKKLTFQNLYLLIESIYDQRFKDEMKYVWKTLNRFSEDTNIKEPESFNKYVFNFFKKKYKNNIKVYDNKILNYISSLEFFWKEILFFDLNYKFLNEEFN